MYLFHLFRSFLPIHNPIGFGVSDFIELDIALLLVLLAIATAWLEPAARKLAEKTGWSMLFLGVLVLILRLALLPVHPVPTASGADDFSYLLLTDTLAHFRLANPPHPMHRFFETTFVLQEPSYSSIYPIGPGLVMAFGQVVFGHPWAGVLLSMALLSGLCYWMLRGWTSPGWALVGGLLVVVEFGPLNRWMNCYWGGAVSAIAGCLVFGALPRLRHSMARATEVDERPARASAHLICDSRPSPSFSTSATPPKMERRARRAHTPNPQPPTPNPQSDAVLLGLGIGIQMLTRPLESVFLDLSVVLFFLPELRRRADWPKLAKIALPAALAVLPAVALQLFHDRAVTGSWTTMPYVLNRYLYGVPTTLTFQPNPVPHGTLTQAQELYAQGQAAVHGETDTLATYLQRLGGRMGFYRFFLLAPLFLTLPFFLRLLVGHFTHAPPAPGPRPPAPESRIAWIALTVLIFALGSNFYPYFFPHYHAAILCLFILAAVLGLQVLSGWKIRGWPAGQLAARWILFLCAVHFLFWYGIHAFGGEPTLQAMTPYETTPGINFGDPEGRIAVNRRLAEAPGRQLVFVRYFTTHEYHDWIHNAADIDNARVVWALELTPDENAKLRQYYPDRKVWLMEPDAVPPKLVPYPASVGPFLTVE